MSTKKITMIGSVALVALLAVLANWLPANAAQSSLYPAKVGTIESGKQGLALSNVPARVKYVAFDLVNFDPNDSHDATISLESVEISTYNLPLY